MNPGIQRRMTFDEITARRKELFERGNMELKLTNREGRMVALNPEGVSEAEEYNGLAAIHGSAPK